MGFKTVVKIDHPEESIWFMSNDLAIKFMNKIKKAGIEDISMYTQDTLLMMNRQLTEDEYKLL